MTLNEFVKAFRQVAHHYRVTKGHYSPIREALGHCPLSGVAARDHEGIEPCETHKPMVLLGLSFEDATLITYAADGGKQGVDAVNLRRRLLAAMAAAKKEEAGR